MLRSAHQDNWVLRNQNGTESDWYNLYAGVECSPTPSVPPLFDRPLCQGKFKGPYGFCQGKFKGPYGFCQGKFKRPYGFCQGKFKGPYGFCQGKFKGPYGFCQGKFKGPYGSTVKFQWLLTKKNCVIILRDKIQRKNWKKKIFNSYGLS